MKDSGDCRQVLVVELSPPSRLLSRSVRDDGAEPNLAICDPFVGAIDLIQLVGLRHDLDLPFGGIVKSFVEVFRSVLLTVSTGLKGAVSISVGGPSFNGLIGGDAVRNSIADSTFFLHGVALPVENLAGVKRLLLIR